MKVGLSSFGNGMGPGDTLEIARQADSYGFDRFMLVEQPRGNDALGLCSAMGVATQRIGIGTGIANIYLRSDEMLALGAAVAAEASGGRFVLGIGPMTKAGVERLGGTWRGARTALAATTETVRHYLAGADGKVPPCKYPVPIVWASVVLGTAKAAGRVADGVMLYLAPEARIKAARERFAAGAEEAGRPTESVEHSLLMPVFLDEDLDKARDAARRHLSTYARTSHYGAMFAEVAGEVGPDNIPDELIDAVVLAGPAEVCRARMDRLAAAGVTHLDLAPFPVGGEEMAVATARVLDTLRPA